MDRRKFLSLIGSVSLLALLGCNKEAKEVITPVTPTESGIVLKYTISKNEDEQFKDYTFKNHVGATLYSPLLSDERWLDLYKSLQELLDKPVNDLTPKDIDPLMGMFAYRVRPTVLTPHDHHTGIDMYKPRGSEVKAVYEGVVLRRVKDYDGGNWIELKHPISTEDGYFVKTRYLHLDSIDEKVLDGVKVEKGQVLGRLGATGPMQGYFPHLHFEVRMSNDDAEKKPLVLDPNRIYFDPVVPDKSFPPNQQEYFRNITQDIEGEDTPKQLAELLNELSEEEKRFLPGYREYWEYMANKGTEHTPLCKELLEELDKGKQ